jgi:flagellar biosynthesis protein FlhB
LFTEHWEAPVSESAPILLLVLIVLLLAAGALTRGASSILDLIGELLGALFASLRALAMIVLLIVLVLVVLVSGGDSTVAVGLLVGGPLRAGG